MSIRISKPQPEFVQICLDDGDHGNLLSIEDVRVLNSALAEIRTAQPKAVLLRQKGTDFCAGRKHESGSANEGAVWELSACMSAWRELPSITVAAARGRCQGFGVGLLAQADISLASRSAQIGFPEINTGLAPSIVCSWLFGRVPAAAALPWVLTGEVMTVDDAYRACLVSRLCGDDDMDLAAEEIISGLLQKTIQALRECKRFSRTARSVAPDIAAALAADSLIRQLFSAAS